jgi:hypothetical protein
MLNTRNGIFNAFVFTTGGIWIVISTILIEVSPWVNSVLHTLLFISLGLFGIAYLPFNRTKGNVNMARVFGFISGSGISSIILGLCEIWAKLTAVSISGEVDGE